MFIVVLILTVVVVTVNLRVFQSYLGSKVSEMVSNEIKTPFRVEKVKLGYFLRIKMENVVALDDYYDTLLKADQLALRLSEIDRQAKMLRFTDVHTQNLDFHLIKHEGDSNLNIKYITDRLKDTTSKDSWNFEFTDVALSDARFRLDDKNEAPETEKMDFKHLDVQQLQTRIQSLKVVNDTISAWIKHLSGDEKSGFQLNNMEAHIKLSPTGWKGDYVRINTPNSQLFLDFIFDYNDYDDLSDFVKAVYMDAKLRDCLLSTTDLKYFVPQVPQTDKQMEVSGTLNGRLNDFESEDLRIQYGENSRFWGDLAISGVTDIENAFIDAQIDDFSTNAEDMAAFAMTDGEPLPGPLDKIDSLQFEGFFKGKRLDFSSKADLKTNLGNVSANISMTQDTTQKPSYKGTITGDSLLLGKILERPSDLGALNFHTNINGKGLDKNLEANIEGYVNRFHFRGNTYDSLMFHGDASSQKFAGDLRLKDESISFNFSGLADLSKKNVQFDFQSRIQHADLNTLGIPNKSDSLSTFSSKIQADFAGNHPDSLSGNVALTDITYHQDNFVYNLDTLMVEADQGRSENRNLKIKSGFLDGSVSGQFLLSELGQSYTNFMYEYLPDVFEYDSADKAKQAFQFDLRFKDTRGLSMIFMPQLTISNGSKIKGSYSNVSDSIFLESQIDTLIYNDIIFRDLRLSTGDEANLYTSNLKVSEIILKEFEEEQQSSLGMERFGLSTKVKDGQIFYNLNWDDFAKSDKNKGTIKGHFEFENPRNFTHKISESNIRINDTLWQIDPSNHITVTDTSTVFSKMGIFTDYQALTLDGALSDNPDDKFGLNFNNFNLSDIDMLLASSDIDINGILNGYLNYSKVGDKSKFTGDIEVERFYLNKERMGKFSLYSSWSDSLQKLNIEGDIVYKGNAGEKTLMKVGGSYWPKIGRANDSLSFDTELNNFSISALQPLFDDFLNSINGMASGKLNLGGSTQKPELTGEVDLMRARMRMTYLKTQYSFADKIKLKPNAIVFDSIKIYDSLGNPAVMNGKINHRYFNDFTLDLHLDTRNFAGLNTTRLDNDLFYGKAFATGRVDVTGPTDDIDLNVTAQTEPNTNVVIPISTSHSVKENDFIVFMDEEEQEEKKSVSLQKMDVGGLNMNFELQITNDAEAEIILPFSMGSITGRGNGNLRLEITSSGEFNMYGDYIIDEGAFLLTLQSMLRRDFSIQRGGRISWNGDPYDATLDITALYRVRPTLEGLPASQSLDPAMAKERIPVNCIINLKDKLFNPNIRFDIELPSSDNRVKEIVYSSIDTTSTAEMNRQMMYLLVLNSFSVSGGMNNTFSSGLGGSSLDLLSNQISSWLSQISRDLDVGINYRPGDNYTSEELEVALSTQLFDDRVSIDGNLGVTNMQKQTQANNMVGDINVEVKITKDGRFRVKAFNQTNNVDLLNVGAPYTQGLGVFYRKEFDSLNELFRKKVREEDNGVPQ